jgi:hypothetical protein
MPRDGCRECLYRRIRCDKTDPSCQKCLKKGIECSGVGKFSFVNGVKRCRRKIASSPSASKIRPSAIPDVTSPELQSVCADDHPTDWEGSNHLLLEHEPSDSSLRHSEQQLSLLAVESSVSPGLPSQLCNVRADLALEGLKPGISELLMTCKFCDHSYLLYDTTHSKQPSLQSYSTNHGGV